MKFTNPSWNGRLPTFNIDIFENLSPNRWKKGISVKFCNRVGTKVGNRPFDAGQHILGIYHVYLPNFVHFGVVEVYYLVWSSRPPNPCRGDFRAAELIVTSCKCSHYTLDGPLHVMYLWERVIVTIVGVYFWSVLWLCKKTSNTLF